MNYIQNISMKAKPQKVQAQEESPTTSLTTSTTTSRGWIFSLYPTSSIVVLKWKVPTTFKSLRSLTIDTFSVGYFAIKSFSWSLNMGKNQGVLTWEMHGGPSINSIVVFM